MVTVHIEHPIRDFESWKAAFDRDPVGREQSGVRRYRIHRPTDDPNYVMIDLDFDGMEAAEGFLVAMRKVWQSPAAARALAGSPQARIVEMVESHAY
jgi:hypothetical protein